MSLPTISAVGRLTEDPDLKFAQNGTAIARIRMAFNSRKKDERGEWVDDRVAYLDGTAFKQLAEHAAESLTRGMEVCVTGRLVTETWEDKKTSEKRSKLVLLIDSIGPSLAFATARVEKMQRDSNGNGGQRANAGARSGGGQADPWNDDQAPF